MKLGELTPGMVAQAVNIYLDLAYSSGSKPRRAPDLSLPADARGEQVLQLFHKDVVEETPGNPSVRYTMRLGNRNYPFMKLLLQEHIVPGEFYFAVDTHDDMEIKPDYPDYEAWMAVCRFNRGLKTKIESGFVVAGLPTASTIRKLVAQRESADVQVKDSSILVVDDEEDLAEAVESLLRARGYTMFKAHDGRSAVETARQRLPSMILLDYELPEMDGLEVIAALRERPETRDIPVLLCTASKISVGDIRKADGFLAKPYQEELLYEMVHRVITSADKKSRST